MLKHGERLPIEPGVGADIFRLKGHICPWPTPWGMHVSNMCGHLALSHAHTYRETMSKLSPLPSYSVQVNWGGGGHICIHQMIREKIYVPITPALSALVSFLLPLPKLVGAWLRFRIICLGVLDQTHAVKIEICSHLHVRGDDHLDMLILQDMWFKCKNKLFELGLETNWEPKNFM